MVRAVWSGAVTFGLVNVPIRLYPATKPRDVRFHQFERSTGRRVRYQRVAEPGWETSEEPERTAEEVEPGPPRHHEEGPPPESDRVAYEDVVKGYEVEDGRYVLVSPEELRALEPERSQTIDIEEFVDLGRVDPVYFERSYWALPDRGSGADKPYALLVRAMAATGKAGVGRFVFRTREHLAALRVAGDVLALHTMFFADEVRDPVELAVPVGGAQASDREVALAEQLITMLEQEWDPARHTDAYRERVMDLIEKKAGGPVVSREPDVARPSPVPDLMAALKASVEAAKKQRQAG